MYVRIDFKNIYETKRPQDQNIWTSDLEDGMTTDGMTRLSGLHYKIIIVK